MNYICLNYILDVSSHHRYIVKRIEVPTKYRRYKYSNYFNLELIYVTNKYFKRNSNTNKILEYYAHNWRLWNHIKILSTYKSVHIGTTLKSQGFELLTKYITFAKKYNSYRNLRF